MADDALPAAADDSAAKETLLAMIANTHALTQAHPIIAGRCHTILSDAAKKACASNSQALHEVGAPLGARLVRCGWVMRLGGVRVVLGWC